jgi:hypothetical protein
VTLRLLTREIYMSETQLAIKRVEEQLDHGDGSNHGQIKFPECLESWKDIASYLQRDVRTVQRWEKSIGLPVHRVQDSKSGSVYARKSEIDSWRRERAMKIAREKLPIVPEKLPVVPEVANECESMSFETGHKRRRLNLIPLLVGLVLGAACSQLIAYFLHSSVAAHSLSASSYTRAAGARVKPMISTAVSSTRRE